MQRLKRLLEMAAKAKTNKDIPANKPAYTNLACYQQQGGYDLPDAHSRRGHRL